MKRQSFAGRAAAVAFGLAALGALPVLRRHADTPCESLAKQ